MKNSQRMASWLLQCYGYSDKILEACKCINAFFYLGREPVFSKLATTIISSFFLNSFHLSYKVKNIFTEYLRNISRTNISRIFRIYSWNMPRTFLKQPQNIIKIMIMFELGIIRSVQVCVSDKRNDGLPENFVCVLNEWSLKFNLTLLGEKNSSSETGVQTYRT